MELKGSLWRVIGYKKKSNAFNVINAIRSICMFNKVITILLVAKLKNFLDKICYCSVSNSNCFVDLMLWSGVHLTLQYKCSQLNDLSL